MTNYTIECEPLVVENLVIGEMAKQMGSYSHPKNIVWFCKDVQGWIDYLIPRFPTSWPLRGHFPVGKIVGETILEETLVKAGYFALLLEDHSILDQLKYYANAEKIIFSEGSAIHMVDLLPALQADVAVFNRRPISTLGEMSLRQKRQKHCILCRLVRVC